jgi:hypothetical protein
MGNLFVFRGWKANLIKIVSPRRCTIREVIARDLRDGHVDFTEPVDAAGDPVTDDNGADTGRRTRHDEVAGRQRHRCDMHEMTQWVPPRGIHYVDSKEVYDPLRLAFMARMYR